MTNTLKEQLQKQYQHVTGRKIEKGRPVPKYGVGNTADLPDGTLIEVKAVAQDAENLELLIAGDKIE